MLDEQSKRVLLCMLTRIDGKFKINQIIEILSQQVIRVNSNRG